MAHLTSRHSLTITLSSGTPAQDSVFTQMHAIQGPTDVSFLFGDIDLGSLGIYGIIFNYGDGSPDLTIDPTFSSNLPKSIPVSTVEHTYYQTTTTASELTATAIVKYLSNSGNKPLSTTHNIIFKQSAENMIEKNLEILNNQLFTIAGSATPIFNLESSENIVYPCTFIELTDPVIFDDNIYINTDPEIISLSDQYRYKTQISLESDITTYGISALSGSGFSVQGKSGNVYTIAFGVSAEPLRYTYTTNTTAILLSADITDNPPSVGTLQDAITGLLYDNNLIGSEFSSVEMSSNIISLFQSNLLPPEATLKTYTTTVSTASAGITPLVAFDFTDFDYSYTNNPYGLSGLTGLSAVNRMKTDKDALLIRAL
jgi:hypothetical protein